MDDLICDVSNCCVWSCDTGEINVYDKIVIENQKKEMQKSKKFWHKSSSKRLFRNGIYSLMRHADARLSAGIIYCNRVWRIFYFAALRSQSRSRTELFNTNG